MADSIRTYIDAPADLVKDIEIFKTAKRCNSRAEAIRRLMEAGAEQFRAQRPDLFQPAKTVLSVLFIIGLSVTYLWLGGEDYRDQLHNEANAQMMMESQG